MPQKKRITQEQEAEMVERYGAGESVYTIAEHLPYAPQTIHKTLVKAGVEMRTKSGRPRTILTKDAEEELVERYRNGDKFGDLARDYCISGNRVSELIDAAGVARRGIGQQPFVPTEDELEDIIERYHSGQRVSGIGVDTGHGWETIERILTEAGIDINKGPRKGPDSPAWRGGRSMIGKYAVAWVGDDDPMAVMRINGDRYVYEHRLVVARSLGRPLTSDESVHHINGNPTDNRLENLQLRQRYHGKGHVAFCGDCGSQNIVHAELV